MLCELKSGLIHIGLGSGWNWLANVKRLREGDGTGIDRMKGARARAPRSPGSLRSPLPHVMARPVPEGGADSTTLGRREPKRAALKRPLLHTREAPFKSASSLPRSSALPARPEGRSGSWRGPPTRVAGVKLASWLASCDVLAGVLVRGYPGGTRRAGQPCPARVHLIVQPKQFKEEASYLF